MTSVSSLPSLAARHWITIRPPIRARRRRRQQRERGEEERARRQRRRWRLGVQRPGAAHAAGNKRAGLDMAKGCVGDMWELGIREAYKSKLQVLISAAEAAEMILRVDDIIKSAPRQREGHEGHHH